MNKDAILRVIEFDSLSPQTQKEFCDQTDCNHCDICKTKEQIRIVKIKKQRAKAVKRLTKQMKI